MRPVPMFTPEQEAKMAEQQRLWTLGMDASLAGLPLPEGATAMAYRSGIARRRAAAGEVIGFVGQMSICSACGDRNWGWRLGCRCWPSDSLNPAGFSMTYGFQVEKGSDPADPACTFMSFDRITELAKGGREVLDIMSGEHVPVEAASV